jgi:8-oxo-dGTP pyrophosphatase MutT (NUDIX family)
MIFHPHKTEQGEPVEIKNPDQPTPSYTWNDSNQVARWTPGSAAPSKYEPCFRQDPTQFIEEPRFIQKKPFVSAGLILVESDMRVWIITPTNHFAGYRFTFPKGLHDCSTLQHTAVKETFEETGLLGTITHLLGDYERSRSQTRFYVGRRIGGSPAEMGWETQSVSLIQLQKLYNFVHTDTDLQVVEDLKKLLVK